MPWIGAAIIGGASLLGGVIGGGSNASAAETAASGQAEAARITAEANKEAQDKQLAFDREAREEYRAAAGRGLGHIDTGVADYTKTISPLLTPAPITLPTYRGLTTQQQIGREDLHRNANAALAASGLRGAGRAGVGAVLDQDRRYIASARDSNDTSMLSAKQAAQGVSNSARAGLAGIQSGAGGAKANTELLVGNQIGGSLADSGRQAAALTSATGNAGANAAANASNINANSTLATGRIAAGTLGSLAGTFSNPSLYSGNPNTSASPYVDSGSWDMAA